jgi:hypothetical protein
VRFHCLSFGYGPEFIAHLLLCQWHFASSEVRTRIPKETSQPKYTGTFSKYPPASKKSAECQGHVHEVSEVIPLYNKASTSAARYSQYFEPIFTDFLRHHVDDGSRWWIWNSQVMTGSSYRGTSNQRWCVRGPKPGYCTMQGMVAFLDVPILASSHHLQCPDAHKAWPVADAVATDFYSLISDLWFLAFFALGQLQRYTSKWNSSQICHAGGWSAIAL